MKKISLLFALCSLLFISACGFTPMHGNNDALRDTTRTIYIAPISGTNGIDLRNNLRGTFGTHNHYATAEYILTVDLRAPEMILKALQRTGDATWQEIRMTARYELRARDGELILRATDTASESYTFVADLVAAQAAHNAAVQNAILVLSGKIETRVHATLSRRQ